MTEPRKGTLIVCGPGDAHSFDVCARCNRPVHVAAAAREWLTTAPQPVELQCVPCAVAVLLADPNGAYPYKLVATT